MVSTVMYITLMMRVISLVLGMQTTCDIRYDKKLEGLMADCKKRNLTSVPRDLPSNIVSLNLQGNFITNLRFEQFASFLKLKSLILSNNRIEMLSEDSFFGLQKLEVLDLAGNIWLDNGSYPRGIFDPVRDLKLLYLGGSVRPGFIFPTYVFLPLSNLTTLVITGAWPFLGDCTGFQSMRRLENLYVQACIFHTIHNLQNDTFSCLRFVPLQSLTIRCIVNVIDVCVFCPLHNLTYLKIYTNFRSEITLKDATRSLYSFTKENHIFKFIDFSPIQNTHSHDIDIVLTRQVMANLAGTCVERLDLSNNRLLAITSDILRATDRFAKCIKYLDFSKNYIIIEFSLCFILKYMINLKEMDFSQNSNRVPLGSYFCTTECSYNEKITSILPNTVDGFQLSISLPPKLKFLNLSNAGNAIPFRYDVSVINGGNLQTVDISHNGYLESPARVSGLSNVTYLDISGMDIKESTLINTDMFRGVEILTAHDTTTFPSLLMSEDSVFFLMMTKLKHLDLSGNYFKGINERTFSKLVNVHTLNLSRNRLDYVPHDIKESNFICQISMNLQAIQKQKQPLMPSARADLFTDEWSYFTVLTAVRLFSQEEVTTSRILLLYQDISPPAKARVPRLLLNVVPEENILEVRPWDDNFWAELHQMIVSKDLDVNVLF